MGTTNFDTVDCDELNVAGVDVTAAMAEVATINGLTASAAELNKLDNCTVTTAELNLLDEAPGLCTFVTAAGAANVAETTITVKDAAGPLLPDRHSFMSGFQGMQMVLVSHLMPPIPSR
jgi:hypothetical protein